MVSILNNQTNTKKIYIIDDICDKNGGLFCHYIYMLPFISYALNKGYIPIIDMKHNRNQYFKDGREFKDNVWEYYFKQPLGIGLDDISQENDIIICDDRDAERFPVFNVLLDIKQSRNKFGKYLNLTKFNEETQKYLDENHKLIFKGETEVLGILCRGTDYLNLKPAGHIVQPQPEEVIKKAKELLEKYNYKKIWLATEDAEIYAQFKKEFGDILLENYQYKYNNTQDKMLYEIEVNRKNHLYNLGKEYLLTIYLLGKCKYFIGGYTGGTVGAWCLSEGFKNQEYIYIWHKGFYEEPKQKIKTKLIRQIFSIKNKAYGNRIYKTLTLLGIDIKLWYKGNNGRIIEYIKK